MLTLSLKKIAVVSMALAPLIIGFPEAMGARDSSPPAAMEHRPVLEITEKKDIYHLMGKITVLSPPQTAWDVVADYEQYPNYITVAKEIKIRSRKANDLIIWQQAHAKPLYLFDLTVGVELKVHETPLSLITFEDQLHKDFEIFYGTWTFTPGPKGTEVVYELTAKMKTMVPNWIIEKVLHIGLERCLTQIRDQILRKTEPGWKPQAAQATPSIQPAEKNTSVK